MLDNPNIITIIEIYIDNMYTHYVTEYCESGNLYSYISNNGYFIEVKAYNVIKKILLAVNHMHIKLFIIHKLLEI